jgi:hypothetical protein
MATKYYRKEIPEMPFYVHGTPLKFEVLETSDAALIAELDKAIHFGRGGIIAINKEEFEEESKKKPSGTISESAYKQKQHRHELSALHQDPRFAAGDVADAFRFGVARPQEREHNPHTRPGLPGGAIGPAGSRPMPDPIELPTTVDLKPPTAKLSEVAAVKE